MLVGHDNFIFVKAIKAEMFAEYALIAQKKTILSMFSHLGFRFLERSAFCI